MVQFPRLLLCPLIGLSAAVHAGQAPATGPGQLSTESYGELREGFAEPDMRYAPFAFWFWDEPVDGDDYPEKAGAMAREMLDKGINPGYAHPRVSMADLLGPDRMAPSPSLPKEQWLSPAWFAAFAQGLQAAEAAGGYFGFVDDYMWPMGRAAGRVIKAHPEIANASLQWEVTNVAGGETISLPPSFFTVAARLAKPPVDDAFTIPLDVGAFPLTDLHGADPAGKQSIGQTIRVEEKRLERVDLRLACWKDTSSASFALEARLNGPAGRLLASRHIDQNQRRGDTVSLDIPEVLPVSSELYIAMVPDPGYPPEEIGWWSKPGDAYAAGTAYENGQPVAGDRYVNLSYRTQPKLIKGEWIWQPEVNPARHTCYFRKSFTLTEDQTAARAVLTVTADNRHVVHLNGHRIGEGSDWSRPGEHDVTRLLGAGPNVLAVEGGGDGGVDALLCDLVIDLTNGETLRISSDTTWRASSHRYEGWTEKNFDDDAWEPARFMGEASAPPWNLSGTSAPYQKATVLSESLRLIDTADGADWTAPADGWWRVYVFQRVLGGDVNVLDTRLAKAFIEQSHQPYLDRYGKRMGAAIPGVFCDTEGNYGNGNGLAWSDDVPRKHTENTGGRDVRLWAPLMLDDDMEGRSARARFDYFEAVSDLYAGFYREVSDWLAGHGLYYIANVWEESLQWQASCVSDHMKVQRAFSMPGTDCLSLKAYDVHDFKETQSVSEFEGRRLQSEIMGAGGWGTFSPVTMKECTNAVIAWGVNHVVPHGIFMTRTLEGNVWVPDWFDRNPCWPHMRLWSGFTRRAAYVNSHGSVVPDVLLINPMDSVWALLGDTGRLWWSPEAGNVGLIDGLYSERVQQINAVYSNAIRALTEHRVEYLIADRHYLRQMTLEEETLVRGKHRFKTIVLPPVAVLPLDVAEDIVAFAQAGGHVYTLGTLPDGSTDNGFNDPAMAALMDELRSPPTVHHCNDGIKEALQARAPGLTSPIEFIGGEFPMLQLRRRIDGRDFFWLANNSPEARECEVRVAGVRGAASVWDCESGKIRPVGSVEEDGDSRLRLAFQPHEGYWLVFDPSEPPHQSPAMALPRTKLLARLDGPWAVRIDPADQPNLEHVVTIPAALTGEQATTRNLTQWDTWEGMPDNFSGVMDYTRTIELPPFEGAVTLDLGEVYHFAEVWVNGASLGARLWPPHRFETNAFHPGTNAVRIRVGNLVNNNYGMKSPSGLIGPVELKLPE